MNPYYQDQSVSIYHGDARSMALPDQSVQCVVTSPPYWGLRKYEGEQEEIWGGDADCEHEWGQGGRINTGRHDIGNIIAGHSTRVIEPGPQVTSSGQSCLKCGAWKGCYGLEPTPEMYVEHTVEFLREIWRVLRDDGVVFWNIGDSYSGSGEGGGGNRKGNEHGQHDATKGLRPKPSGILKPKDLCLIPFRVALAAQSDGWYIRSVIIWAKPNPMPESVKDRPTSSYEQILMLTKSQRYYWDIDAVKETRQGNTHSRGIKRTPPIESAGIGHEDWCKYMTKDDELVGRNLRDLWMVPTMPFPLELKKNGHPHFATFPEKIPETCIQAASSERGCCPKCGAPRVRVIERTGHVNKREAAHVPGNTPTKVDSTGWAPTMRATDKWQPSCSCNLNPIPCTVLDPFMGSGTTLAVAKRLGRRAIGFDVSEEYCAMGVKRCGAQMVMEFA